MKQKLTPFFPFPQQQQEAEAAEKAQPPYPITCRVIVAAVVGLGVEDADRKRTWLADANEAASRGAVETARAILGAATAALPTKKSVWLKAAELERTHGEAGAVDALLKKAVTFCPQVSVWGGGREGWLPATDTTREVGGRTRHEATCFVSFYSRPRRRPPFSLFCSLAQQPRFRDLLST